MKAKEIHDLLISLALRGVGIWLLFGSVTYLIAMLNDFLFPPSGYETKWTNVDFLALHVLAATYFLLGAPPFLKWATRMPAGSAASPVVKLPPVPTSPRAETAPAAPDLRKD